jgi:isocitrate dehydrogenase (NAD+)
VKTIVVLEGDRTGQELLEQALRVLEPGVLDAAVALERFDCSLAGRERTGNQVVRDAAARIRETGYGLKAATDTLPELGSPNLILREEIGATVIVRGGRRLPGVIPLAGVHYPIWIVRMAIGGSYGADEYRETLPDGGEQAVRTERISRRVCTKVAEYAFRQAKLNDATVFGGPKWTVSPVFEGMLKEEMDAAAARHPLVRYRPELIDATMALLFRAAQESALVIPTLNRDGDLLADLVLPLYGSIASGESLIVALDDQLHETAIVAEAAHGTAPALEGKNVANPLAMLLSIAALLERMPSEAVKAAGAHLRTTTIAEIADGICTGDLGGHATTSAFVDAVIARL